MNVNQMKSTLLIGLVAAIGLSPLAQARWNSDHNNSGGGVVISGGQYKGGQVKGGQVKGGQVKGGQVKGGQVKGGQIKSTTAL